MVMLNMSNGNPHADICAGNLAEHTDEIMRLWDALVGAMDDDAREQVHAELAPCTEIEFLARYLEVAPCDLVIG